MSQLAKQVIPFHLPDGNTTFKYTEIDRLYEERCWLIANCYFILGDEKEGSKWMEISDSYDDFDATILQSWIDQIKSLAEQGK